MGHPQPAIPLTNENITAEGILNGTLKRKLSKSIDMRFDWLKDIALSGNNLQSTNLADYPTEHHAGKHHRKLRAIYLYIKKKCKGALK